MAINRHPLAVSDHTSSRWRDREAEIARIVARQHGQITTVQLLGAGMSETAIRNRVRTGRLHRIHRGVYSAGRPPQSPAEHRMAAVLACGPVAVLSHALAAAHLDIRPSAATLLDVTSPTGAGRGLDGIRAHRSTLSRDEIVEIDRIPTTSCARTLFDLAEALNIQALARAFDRAEVLGLIDLRALEKVMQRNPGRRDIVRSVPFSRRSLREQDSREANSKIASSPFATTRDYRGPRSMSGFTSKAATSRPTSSGRTEA